MDLTASFPVTAQERERTIPETIDEKFAIEPLNMKRDKVLANVGFYLV